MVLPKGSRIDCEAHFDNSSNNPYNPDPTKLVRWGEQTWEEMMIGYVDVDVPVGAPPPIEKTELRPAVVRIGQSAIQALRGATGGDCRDRIQENQMCVEAPGREVRHATNREDRSHHADLSDARTRLAFCAGLMTGARADEPGGRDIPPAFSPLEYLVGRWQRPGRPMDTAQKFRGWSEDHTWAWIFTSGKPTGLSVTIEGGKILGREADLRPGKKVLSPRRDHAQAGWRPDRLRRGARRLGQDPGPGPGRFGRGLGDGHGRGKIRLSIYPNANFIRYTMQVARKEAGDSRSPVTTSRADPGGRIAGRGSCRVRPPQVHRDRRRRGHDAHLQRPDVPICCTGCRDEFNENPEKYIKKASLMAESRGSKAKASQPAPARVGRFDDALSGDVADSPAMKTGDRSSKAAPRTSRPKAKPVAEAGGDTDAPPAAGKSKSATKKTEPKTAGSRPAARAASLLRIAQNLEKSGKTAAALEDYKQIVKDYGDTPAARTARQRIKALEKP